MICMMRRLFWKCNGSAVVEAAIFTPIFLLLTLGVADLGIGMFIRMSVNAATQAGAIYAAVNSGQGKACESLTTTCQTNINATMNAAAGDPSFCSTATCSASIGTCADGSPECVIVSASYTYTPLAPDVLYTWAQATTVVSTATVRVQ